MSPLISLSLLSLLLAANANAQVHVPIARRTSTLAHKTEDDWKSYRDNLIAKYSKSSSSSSKRSSRPKKRAASSAGVEITNLEFDTTYYATVNIGSSSTPFNVILDTGSSDLWIASSSCQSCGSAPSLSPSQSSSLQVSSQSIDLKYGSGEAQGTLVEDNVGIAGTTFSISPQQFVLASDVSSGLLQGSLSGLLGLGWSNIAQTGATPLLQAIAQGNELSAPEFSFYLDRLLNVPSAAPEAPGGIFSIGGTNSSLFQGDIDFVDFPSGATPGFWLLPVSQVTVNGNSLSISGTADSLAAIDTGTTLIGGPTDAVTAIYSKIPNSNPLQGQMQGYFSIPCDKPVNIAFSFSSKSWGIDPVDFNVQSLNDGTCLGGLFAVDLGGQGNPDWIVGDTFLKNVYSVFRFSPPSVGFATLASNLQGSHSNLNPTTSPSPSSSTSTSTGGGSSAGAPVGSKTVTLGGGPLPTDGSGTTSGVSGSQTSGSSSSGSGSSPFVSGASGLRQGGVLAALVLLGGMGILI